MRNAKTRVEERRKSNGKRGFTLVELVIVIVLLVLVVGLIASFVTVTSRFVTANNQIVAFGEQATDVRDALSLWLSASDTADTTYRVAADGTLSVDGTPVLLQDGTLSLGTYSLDGVTQVESITFAASGGVIRCTLTRLGTGETAETFSFLLAPRSATVLSEEVTV